MGRGDRRGRVGRRLPGRLNVVQRFSHRERRPNNHQSTGGLRYRTSDGSALVYSTYLDGGGLDGATGIAIDSAGNAYIAGTATAGFPTANAFSTQASGGFLAKLSAASPSTPPTLSYSTFLDGSPTAIAVDSASNAYAVGSTTSLSFPVTATAFQPTNRQSGFRNTGFLIKINTLAAGASSLQYSTYFGGSDSYNGEGEIVNSAGITSRRPGGRGSPATLQPRPQRPVSAR